MDLDAVVACCRAASVLPPWNSRCKIELIFGVMLQFNVVWCIHSRREIVLTVQSDNCKQGYKIGGKKYRRPKVVLSRRPSRTVWQRLDSETRPILSSQRGCSSREIPVPWCSWTGVVSYFFFKKKEKDNEEENKVHAWMTSAPPGGDATVQCTNSGTSGWWLVWKFAMCRCCVKNDD